MIPSQFSKPLRSTCHFFMVLSMTQWQGQVTASCASWSCSSGPTLYVATLQRESLSLSLKVKLIRECPVDQRCLLISVNNISCLQVRPQVQDVVLVFIFKPFVFADLSLPVSFISVYKKFRRQSRVRNFTY